MLAGLGAAGGFVVLPLRKSLRFALLVAPFVGALCMALGTAVFYTTLVSWSLKQAAVVTWIGCLVTTLTGLIICRPKPRWSDLGLMICAAVALAVIATRTVDEATIRHHGPAMLYCDATDHMGYTQAADWLKDHPVSVAPQATPQSPCNAWLALLFRIDPRFGTYFLLGIIATAHGTSSTFSYDIACAICLCAAILGVAGAFARSRWSLLLLLVGLLVSLWFDDSRMGYLGKMIGYPAAIMLAGLFFALPQRPTLESVLVLALIASASAIMHSGAATGMFLLVIGGTALLARLGFVALQTQRMVELDAIWQQTLVLGLLVAVAIMSSGAAARPMVPTLPDFGVKWKYILPRALDIEHPGANATNVPEDHLPPLVFGREEKLVSGFDKRELGILTKVACGLWICLAGIAVVRREPVAIGLLLGPMLLLLGLWWGDKRPEAFQMIGFFYPTTLCGLARLIDGPRPATRGRWSIAWPAALAILAIVLVGMRVPRYAGSVKRYAGPLRPRGQEFSLAETDRLTNAIGSEPVEVALPSVTHLLFTVVELNNRGVQLRWSPASFYSAFAYMVGWQPPAYPPTRLRLALAEQKPPPGWRVVLKAPPFWLLSR